MLNVRQRRQAERQQYLLDLVAYRMSPHKIAELLEIDLATVKRWLAGVSRIPRMAIVALEAFDGRFPNMDQWAKKWTGCKISPLDGLLYTEWSNKRGFSQGEIANIMHYENRLEGYRLEVQALRAKIEHLARPAVLPSANDAIAPSFEDLRPVQSVMALADVSLNPRTAKARALKKKQA